MDIPSGPATTSEAETLGAYWKHLLTKPSWTRRRVESVAIIDESTGEWRDSLDISATELAVAAGNFGLGHWKSMPVPLAALTKELQLDIDATVDGGSPLSILVSDCDTHIAHAYFLKEVADSGIALKELPGVVIRQLYDVIREDDGLAMFEIVVASVSAYRQAATPNSGQLVHLTEREAQAWVAILDVDFLYFLLEDLAAAYFMSAQVNLASDSIVKFRLLGQCHADLGAVTIASLGPKPIRVRPEVRGLGTALREHTHFVAPPGTRIVGARLVRDDVPMPESEYTHRSDWRRAVFYTVGLRPATYQMEIQLVPALGGFFLPALICAALIAFLAGAGGYLEYFSNRFTLDVGGSHALASSDASAAILALVPTAFAVFLVKDGEHRLVYRVVAASRMLLLTPAIMLFFCAAGIAASIRHSYLWVALVSTSMAAIFTTAYFLWVSISVRFWLRRKAPNWIR